MLLVHHFDVNFLACISASEVQVLPFLVPLSPVVSFNRMSTFFLLLVNKNTNFFFWTQLFNLSLFFIYLFLFFFPCYLKEEGP